MPVPTSRADLSTTAASNSPAGSEAIGTNADDYLRAHAKCIADSAPIDSPTFTGVVTGPGYTVTGSTVPANGIYRSAANTFAIASNTTVRYTINSTGNHTIQAPSAGTTMTMGCVVGENALLTSDGTANFAIFHNGASGVALNLASNHALTLGTNNATRVTIAAGGDVTFTGTATSPDFIETSSRELKSDIVAVEGGALERIQSLDVKEYKFQDDGRKRVGVIAEDVPSRYSVGGKAVSLTAVIFDLVKAVQELAAK
jgi:hypothetical protein